MNRQRPNAVEEANALAQAIRERGYFRGEIEHATPGPDRDWIVEEAKRRFGYTDSNAPGFVRFAAVSFETVVDFVLAAVPKANETRLVDVELGAWQAVAEWLLSNAEDFARIGRCPGRDGPVFFAEKNDDVILHKRGRKLIASFPTIMELVDELAPGWMES